MTKKLIYIATGLMMVLSSCDPMKDTYRELDASNGGYTKDMVLTLTADDYTLAKAPNPYFSSETEASTGIPTILNSRFAQLDNGSRADVTYKSLTAFSDFSSANEVSRWNKYTVQASDYTAMGLSHPNFGSADITRFLEEQYPKVVAENNVGENALAILTFDFFNGKVTTVTDAYYKLGDEWVDTYLVSNEDYASVGYNYNDFDSSADANLPFYFNAFLKADLTTVPMLGMVKYVTYYYYAGSTNYRVMAMYYDGNNWQQLTENKVFTEDKTLSFAKKNDAWVLDGTVNYTLQQVDYDWIIEDSKEKYPDASSNLSGHYDFYINQNYWSIDMINEELIGRLKVLYPTADVDQKFAITIAVYGGSAPTMVLNFVVKDTPGNIVVDDTTEE